MPRFFVNNFSTTLSANITNVQTTLPLQTNDGLLLPTITLDTPQDTDFLLTIDDGTNRETVRVIEHNGSDTIATIQRDHDGFGQFAFLSGDTVEMRVTRSSLQELWLNMGPQMGGVRNARGQFAVEMIPYFSSTSHAAEADRSIGIGSFVGIHANQTRSIVIGDFCQLTSSVSDPNIVIGGSVGSTGINDGVLIGHDPALFGNNDRTVKVGNDGQSQGRDCVLIGDEVNGDGDHAVIIGSASGRTPGNETRNAVVLGCDWNQAAIADTGNTWGALVIGQAGGASDFPIKGLARIQWPRAFGGILNLEDGTDKPSYSNNGTEITLATHRFDNTAASPFGSPPAAFYTFQLPADAFMFVEEVGVVFDRVNGGPSSVTTDMVIDVGSSGNGSTEILNAQIVSNGVVPTARTKEEFASAIPSTGVNAVTITIDTPALYDTGDVDCYAYVRGILYQGT